MTTSPSHGLSLVDEAQASGDVAAIFEDIKRTMQAPTVPNMVRALAVSPAALKVHMAAQEGWMTHLTLPMSLVSMICYTIAERSDCEYCAAANELTCRTLGVDDATLSALAKDFDNVNPERIRAIIEFSYQAAKHPQSLEPADYDALRAYGISNPEIVEIVVVAGLAKYLDIIADALKIPVDDEIAEALPHRQQP